jgi:hypothetical protein
MVAIWHSVAVTVKNPVMDPPCPSFVPDKVKDNKTIVPIRERASIPAMTLLTKTCNPGELLDQKIKRAAKPTLRAMTNPINPS